jgi:hypothetical protein
MLAKVPNFKKDMQAEVQGASDILRSPLNLFLQALATFNVLHHVIGRATTFFAQHRKSNSHDKKVSLLRRKQTPERLQHRYHQAIDTAMATAECGERF